MRLRAALLSILLVATVAGAFILIDDTHDQTVGGTKTHVLPVIGTEICANLPVPPTNGELQYCADCVMPSHPCVSGGTGAMAAYINGNWECFPGGNAVVATPSPQPTATPTGGGSCPAGADTDVQYNDASSCGGDSQFTWQKTISRLNIALPTPASTPTPGFASIFLTNNQNTAGSGAWVLIRQPGTAATADEGVSFDVGTGSNRYFSIGRVAQSGTPFRFISNNAFNPDMRSGTGWLEIQPDTSPAQFKVWMTGTSTVPGFSDYTDNATGLSLTSSGGLQRTFSLIVSNSPTVQIEHTITGDDIAGIQGRFRLIDSAPSPLTGAGPDSVVPTNALMELSTTNAGGTAVVLDTTNIQEGQVVRVMNTSANDLTFVTASAAGYCQKTDGGATQTLSGDGSNIEFISHSSCWYQSHAVMNPS